MSNKHSNIFAPNHGAGGSFNAQQFLSKILFHWPLYIICLIIILGLGVFYLKYTAPVYDISATVLVKGPHLTQKSPLDELELTKTERDIEAEASLLNSLPNIEQIVTDLQLWVTYTQKTRYLNYKDIYVNSPVQFKLIKSGRNFSDDYLDIVIENENYFLLKQSNNKTKRLMFKNNLVNSFGTWKLDTTKHLRNFIGKTIRINLVSPREAVNYYAGNIGSTVVPKSNDISVTLQDEVPVRGTAIVNDLLRVYIDAEVAEKRQSSQKTLKFVQDRLYSLTQELNNVENKYQDYKSVRGITEISDISGKFVNNSLSTDAKVNEIDIQLKVLDGIERYVNSDQGADNPPATIGLEDQGLQSLIRSLTDLQLQRTKLLATLPENNPLFNPIDQQIKTTRNALIENLKGIRGSLMTTKSQLQSLGTNYQSSIRNIPYQEKDLADIKRMQGIKENLYTYLLQRKEEISMDYASTIPDGFIVDRAESSPKKWPKSGPVLAVALLFGLLIPTGILFGRDVLKTRVVRKSEITFSTGMPVLSEIVYDESDGKSIVLNQNSYIGEQFRDLRTKLNYLHGKHEKGKVTLITSSIAGEGKSFILSNLGTVLSASGKKTVILELDLRRPTILNLFQLDKSKPGLTSFLIGDATKTQIIQPLGAISDNLFVIESGTIPPNPSELLESEELASLVKDLRLEFDHILIDSPPMHLLTDAMIIAPMCDVTLYLIRQDYTPKEELEFISELNAEKKLPKLNLIFNGVIKEKFANVYNYQKSHYYSQPPKKLKHGFKSFLRRF
jgi:capsular exopolysaccharide synthesis family protein